MKIGGFGNAVSHNYREKPLKSKVSILQYMAPEMLNANKSHKNKGYGSSVDIWAAGVVLYGLVYGTLPFQAGTEEMTIDNIKRGVFGLPEKATKDCRDLLKKILTPEVSERLTIPEILDH